MKLPPQIRLPAARLLLAAMLFDAVAAPLAGQDASDRATRLFMQQRVAELQRQQRVYSQDMEIARRLDPQKAVRLQMLMQDNQLLLERYQAKVAGQPDPTAAVMPDPERTKGLSGLFRIALGMETPPTVGTIALSTVAGLGGWLVGKMMFGPVGGIVGGIVGPMLANFVAHWLRERSSPTSLSAGASPVVAPGATNPDDASGLVGRPAPAAASRRPSAPASDVTATKAQLDAAYRSFREAVVKGLPPEELLTRREAYLRLRSAYSGATAGQ